MASPCTLRKQTNKIRQKIDTFLQNDIAAEGEKREKDRLSFLQNDIAAEGEKREKDRLTFLQNDIATEGENREKDRLTLCLEGEKRKE